MQHGPDPVHIATECMVYCHSLNSFLSNTVLQLVLLIPYHLTAHIITVRETTNIDSDFGNLVHAITTCEAATPAGNLIQPESADENKFAKLTW